VTGERFFHIVIPLCIGIVGFIIAISTMRLAARYVALYVSCLGDRFDGHLIVISFLMAQSYAGFICFLAWTSGTFARSASKRAVALAFVNAFSQLGNIAGSYEYFSFVLRTPLADDRGAWTDTCGKNPGVRVTSAPTRFASRPMGSAS